MSDWINAFLNGLLLGGLYALFATGLSLSFGIMRIVNIAHGDLAILGAFLAFSVAGALRMNPWAAAVLCVAMMFVVGYAMQRILLEKALDKGILPPLLVTFGLSIVLQNGLQEVYSADPRGFDVGALSTASIPLTADLAVGVLPTLTMAIAVAVLVFLQALFTYTPIGRAFRATSDDADAAQLVGLNHRRIYGIAMGLAVAVAAVAGVFLAVRANVSPTEGQTRLLYAFEAVIIGGLGSIWGTLAGGTILGIAQSIGMKVDPGWGTLAGHLIFLAVLVARPNGLFPRTRDR
ncbi:branched-chain amino acid ABC transporter permease [Burkholderia sp. Ac-20353]|uniref:branched-chain amino acid ABC transporter permease n=1 Tax=Burkholderia sp. Ac-20353 TaxID=2703894 RepID=UPI00197BE32C|nr:branched-chain amino acid ABC transporter permease [Burkholderia sp. Ac-20353]MBN3785993.1 branched-chain amino acid ABC transporter permease [Burkholderia sp. Ac-20353]